jgi:aryl-alcohol dehydrogenase-like predicted oxidoreductase
MQYRRLGDTELTVSALSLGTVALGMSYGITPKESREAGQAGGMPRPSQAEVTRLVHRAIDQGINFIDTARGYGDSEEVLGHALGDRRQDVVLATKIGCFGPGGQILEGKALRQQMESSLATSLRLLQTDWVDLLMLHSAPVELLQQGEALQILKEFQARGATRAIGASTYGAEAAQLAIDAGVNALQVAFNILDQRLADEVLPRAKANGVGIVVRSVFLKGVLTPRADDLPPHLAPLRERSESIQQFAASLTPPMTRVEAALRFVLCQPDVTSALVGVVSEAELDASLQAAAAVALSPEVMDQFKRLRWDDPVMLDPSRWDLP